MEVRFSDVFEISKDTIRMKNSFFSAMFFLQGLHTKPVKKLVDVTQNIKRLIKLSFNTIVLDVWSEGMEGPVIK